MLEMDPAVRWYDYSKQAELSEAIIDIIAKNYSHKIPLIFGKWDYLKKNPRIDIHHLNHLARASYKNDFLMSDAMSSNCKYSIDFGTYDGDIAFQFYVQQINNAHYPLEKFLRAIDDKEIMEFIDKIFYSYERLHRQNFYKSQGHYFLYKGQKEKAQKCFIKSVNSNDLLSAEDKVKFKKGNPKIGRDFGITLCR